MFINTVVFLLIYSGITSLGRNITILFHPPFNDGKARLLLLCEILIEKGVGYSRGGRATTNQAHPWDSGDRSILEVEPISCPTIFPVEGKIQSNVGNLKDTQELSYI